LDTHTACLCFSSFLQVLHGPSTKRLVRCMGSRFPMTSKNHKSSPPRSSRPPPKQNKGRTTRTSPQNKVTYPFPYHPPPTTHHSPRMHGTNSGGAHRSRTIRPGFPYLFEVVHCCCGACSYARTHHCRHQVRVWARRRRAHPHRRGAHT
jgi:hypothetical protein